MAQKNTCPHCGKKFTWWEIYKIINFPKKYCGGCRKSIAIIWESEPLPTWKKLGIYALFFVIPVVVIFHFIIGVMNAFTAMALITGYHLACMVWIIGRRKLQLKK